MKIYTSKTLKYMGVKAIDRADYARAANAFNDLLQMLSPVIRTAMSDQMSAEDIHMIQSIRESVIRSETQFKKWYEKTNR